MCNSSGSSSADEIHTRTGEMLSVFLRDEGFGASPAICSRFGRHLCVHPLQDSLDHGCRRHTARRRKKQAGSCQTGQAGQIGELMQEQQADGLPKGMIADSRPKRRGWAPGRYMCGCVFCGEPFVGDKRAIECAACAYRPDGELCNHPGCLQHTEHPCEGCGRIGGKRVRTDV